MTNNDMLRRLRYAMDIPDRKMLEIFALAGTEVSASTLAAMLKREDDPEFLPLDDKLMTAFLDGLIIFRRGKKEPKAGVEPPAAEMLDNNLILKKLRIALNLEEEDMLAILKLAEVILSKNELSALFRKPGHKNYKKCGDQFLRNFLKGLTIRLKRPVLPEL
jgi:uncharacterized protein YehS (DUF1456 family)